ncbi:MAG: glycosyltransferase family 4 protein [Planctomycetota bacterium]
MCPSSSQPLDSPLHVLHVDPEHGYSGGEVQVFLLIDGLLARGWRCSLVAQPDSPVARAGRERGLTVIEVPIRGDLSFGAVRRLARAMRELQPDVVHCHTGRANWIGGLAARAAGLPAVSTRRMDRRVKRNAKNRWIYGSLLRRTAAISPAVLRALHEGGVPKERCELIWSVVDPRRLQASRGREAMRSALGIDPAALVLFAAGSLVERKGYDLLLRAMAQAQVPGLQLVVAGEGPEGPALARLGAELGLRGNVTWLGRREDMADLLGMADGFAMPSRAEGLGIAAVEAMGAGLPVLASAVGGLADLVLPGRTGWLLPADDLAAWSAVLGQFAADGAARRALGEAGRERVQSAFLPDPMVEAYLGFYRRALKSTP